MLKIRFLKRFLKPKHSKTNVKYFEGMRERRLLVETGNYKPCFKCQEVKPLDEFEDNHKKFQLPSQRKKGFLCKTCLKNREYDRNR